MGIAPDCGEDMAERMIHHLWVECPSMGCERQVLGNVQVNYRVQGINVRWAEIGSVIVTGKCDGRKEGFSRPLSKSRVKLYRVR